MQWLQVLTIVVAVFGMFMWVRRETNSDSRELRSLLTSLGMKMDRFNDDMKKEAKDFHGRLCHLEERMRGK